MQLPVLDTQGTQVGTLEVSDLLFDIPMNTSVVHQATVRQRANARQGTASTKTRGHVSGGGIKPRPQKHSGRSRQGSIRAPQWKGGGIVFGPTPRSFRQRIPKKMRRLAIWCLLSDKARQNRLTVLQSLELPQARTKEMSRVLSALNVTSRALLVTPGKDQKVVLSARNLAQVKTLPASNLNVLDLLNHDQLIMTVEAVRKVEELWAGGAISGDLTMKVKTVARRVTTRRRSVQKEAAGKAGPSEAKDEIQAPPSDQVPEGRQET